MEALLEKGYSPDSEQGQKLLRQIERQQNAEAMEKYAKSVIDALPGIGVKFGQRNTNDWLGGLKDMITGAFVDANGKRHTVWSDRKDRKAARQLTSEAKTQTKNAKKALTARLNAYKSSTDPAKREGAERYEQTTADLRKAKAQVAKLEKKGADKAAIDKAKANVASLEDQFRKVLEETGLAKVHDAVEKAEKNEEEAKKEQKEANTSAKVAAAKTTAVLASLANSLSSLSDTIAGYRSQVDTRLHGSTMNEQLMGSYWQQIAYDFSATMLSPLIKEETLTNNLLKAVDMGIARDVEQFAMLETVKDKIATTFDTFDGTMLRLMKIQDENTTAARLGMEASLNELLNEMYETTEYLSSLASTVRSSLEEAEALMGGASAVELEYQVQK